ncbi:hypothetical protein VYU27_000074 [Nannochloropsis oceanica]
MARILAGPFSLACVVVALAASSTTRAFAVGQSKNLMASAHATARSQIKTSSPLSSASSSSRSSASMRMMLAMPLSRTALSSTPSASILLPFLRQRGGAGSTSISASPTKVGGLDTLTLLSTFMGYTIIAGSMLFKVPQAARIFRKKSASGLSSSITGELAPSTLILQAAGNLARIFTTFVQVQNNLFLLSCVVAMLFNGALVAQFFMYRGQPPVRPSKEVW